MSIKELEHRYRTAQEPNEGTWWQIWWLLAQGNAVTELPKVIGVSGFTVGETVTAIGQASFLTDEQQMADKRTVE